MRTSLIALVALNSDRVIGQDGRLPWHHPADLRRFARRTRGHTLLMGRKTWDSLPTRPLPGRRNQVLSRRGLPDAPSYPSLEALLASIPKGETEAFVIGGAQLYAALWSRLDAIEMTWVPDRIEGSGRVFFPELEPELWQIGPKIPFSEADKPETALTWQRATRLKPGSAL